MPFVAQHFKRAVNIHFEDTTSNAAYGTYDNKWKFPFICFKTNKQTNKQTNKTNVAFPAPINGTQIIALI